MISLKDLAQQFEDGLNAQLDSIGLNNIRFHIWGTAGEEDIPYRDGNTVTDYIGGTLTRVASENEAARIEMGANTLSLDLFVKIKEPRTDIFGTTNRIVQGQYPYLDQIITAIDEYFKIAQTQDFVSDGKTYAIGISAGMAISGVVDILPNLGNGVMISVGISLTYVAGGINSRDITLTIDGTSVIVPYQSVQFGASNALESDVQSGQARRKSFASSTACSFTVAFPATKDEVTAQALSFLFGLEPNVAHFVTVGVVDDANTYLMMIDAPSLSAQQVMNAGLSVDFIEIIDDGDVIQVPDAYQVGRFEFASSSASSLAFTAYGLAYIGGDCITLTGATTISLQENDFSYDETDDTYYIYLITPSAASVVSDTTFEITKEASNGQ